MNTNPQIGVTDSGQPIHYIHKPGLLKGQDALDAHIFHTGKSQDNLKMARTMERSGAPGLAKLYRGKSSHHARQAAKYAADLHKSNDLESKLKSKFK